MLSVAILRTYTNAELTRVAQSKPDSTDVELELARRFDACLEELRKITAELEETRNNLDSRYVNTVKVLVSC